MRRQSVLLALACIITIPTLVGIAILFPPQTVDGNSITPQPTPQPELPDVKTCYLGMAIYQDTTKGDIQHIFEFHGVLHNIGTSAYANDYLIIAHRVKYRSGYAGGVGMSNIYRIAEKGEIFRLLDATFRLIDYDGDWIKVERL